MSQGSFTNLTQLLGYFQQTAAANGTVTLDDTFLSAPLLTAMQAGLVLANASLALRDLPSENITLSEDQTTITITGATATDEVVNLSGAPISVAIQQTTANSATGYDLIVNVGLAATWTFGSSFPKLDKLQLPDYLTFASGPFLCYSSFAKDPGITNFPAPSGAGLNYTAAITPAGVFGAIASLLKPLPTSLPLAGIIIPDPIEFDLMAPVTTQTTINLGYMEAKTSAPWLGIRVVDDSGGDSTKGIRTLALVKGDGDDTASTPALLYYLGVNVSVENQAGTAAVDFELDIQIPTAGTSTPFDVALKPSEDAATALSLGNLSAVLFNSDPTGSAITTAVAPLGSVISALTANITLKALSATFQVSDFSIQSVSGLIGTSTAGNGWSPGLPGLPEIELDLNWSIPFSTNAWTVDFSATMTIQGSKPLVFKVDVAVPSEVITGTETGSVSIGLQDLGSAFGADFQNLGDVASLTFTNFTISADIPNKLYTVSGTLALTLNLFGVQLLSVQDMNVDFEVQGGDSTTYTFKFDGTIVLGSLEIAATGTVTNDPKVHTVFTMHLVHQTVGSMLNNLVQLVDPSYTLTFDAPWDAFFNLSLDALVLTVDVTAGSVGLTYSAAINLGFIEIDSIGLTYTKAQGTTSSSVKVELTGSFLGQKFDTNNPLSWDAVNEAPPAAPAPKTPIFDLVYAGLGQHVAINDPADNIAGIMKQLQSTVIPVQAGAMPSIGPGQTLQFSADSNWLIGAQFTVAGAVSISAIFNDPALYGILISLGGDKVKSFAGLSFEILYRKVTDSIGVYHIELKLPDAMRNLQFGEVSVVLPVVVLDIYTNGNFRVDFGFPVGLDFSNSFSVQVFPFVGYGGFYFALLDGSTSSKVPKISNGDWSPVIEFGIALSLGVGKTINEGILSGGISVTVIGILQGVLAWFNPKDNSNKEMYYWFQGSISIVGKLYATIDFGIIQASLDVTAYATVTLTIEAHQPIYISINAGVSVEVKVKIVFFTVHFSFNATVSASFTIGSATPTPWILASGGGSGSNTALRAPAPRTAVMVAGMPRMHSAYVSAMMARPGFLRAMRKMLVQAPGSLLTWPAFNVFPGQTTAQSMTLFAMPGFTKAGTSTTSATAVFMLTAPNSVPPTATTCTECKALADLAAAAVAPFNLLMQAMLSWGIWVVQNPNGSNTPAPPTAVTADQLEQLNKLLKDPATLGAAFDYTTLTNFLGANFTFTVTPADSSEQGVAVFPVFPALTLSDNGLLTSPVNFGTPTVDSEYAAKVRAYFALLQVQFQSRNQGQSASARALAGDAPTVSMAQVVFSQYFNMLMSAGVQAAIDLLASYALTTTAASSIADIGTAIGDSTLANFPLRAVTANQDLTVLNAGAQLAFNQVTHQIAANDTWASVVAAFSAMKVLNTEGAAYTVADLVDANLATSGIYNPHVTLAFRGLSYTTLANESFQMIAARLLVRAGSPGLLNAIEGVTAMTQQLQAVNTPSLPWVANPNTLIPGDQAVTLPAGTYQSVVNGTDTLAMIAGYLCYAAQTCSPVSGFAAQIAALNPGVSSTPPANTTLQMPPVVRTLASSDSINSLTDLLLGESAQIITNITAPAEAPYTSQTGDTLNVIAARALVTAGGAVLVNALPGLAAEVATLISLNKGMTDATVAIAPGIAIVLPGNAVYTTVTGDTLTLVAAYQLEIGAAAAAVSAYVTQLLAINSLSVTDPTALQTPGTAILPPPANALLAAPGVLQVPLIYPIQAADKFSGIASKFNLTLQEVADAANGPAVFAASQAITISDVESIVVSQLLNNLLEQAEFNNASGMVSRFLLSGLQLPDPKSNFENLTLQQLQDPTVLGAIPTLPMYQLTGQQYGVTAPVTATYEITLTNSAGATWLQFPGGAPGSSTPFSFPLTSDAITQANAIAAETFTPTASVLTRLALFQMTPRRVALQNQISWQAAVLPAGFTGGTPGSPDIWLFPDSLVLQLQNATPPPLRYQVAVAKDATPDTPVNAAPAQQYLWGTIVDFDIALPTVDGPATSVANTYVINGADDTGAALLQSVFNQIQGGADTATLYLLYSPANNATGLISDNVNAASSYILKTNLSTLTNPNSLMSLHAVQFDPDSTYAGALSDAVSFVALLFEASVTRSGGFYLNYFNGTAALPSTVFGNSSTATISLLVMLNSQNSPDSPILPFNNCAVVLDNIDPTTSTVFVQPAIYVVQAGDSFTTAASAFNTAYGATFTPAQVAAFNQAVPQVLLPGASITLPNSGTPYTIQYGDSLVSIANAKGTDPVTLAGLNLTVPILEPGSPMQFAANILTPATTVPPGTTGFEMTMPNNSDDEVGSLFNMLGFNIAPVGGFLKSGAGLPTTPSSSSTPSANGLGTNPPADDASAPWYFTQSMAVAPFATIQNGSASTALPPAAQNPYNGVGAGSKVTIDLALLDIYGNSMPIPGATSLSVPVGYYDDIISLGSWPSMAISYTVSGTSPVVTFDMSMQQARYIPMPSVVVDSALQSAAADFDTYTKIYYQIAQPDFFFTAQTTLDTASMTKAYSLSSLPFDAFARGAYIYLSALSPLVGAQFTATASGAENEVASVAALYGVTGAQLFTANQNQSFVTLFGTPAQGSFPLQVPLMYATVNGDTLQSIATAQGTTVANLATMNAGVALAAGVDLSAARAAVTAAATDSLATIATRAQASAAGLVAANPTQAILVEGATFTVGTKSFTLGASQSFTDAADGLGVTLTALANANQFLTNIFVNNSPINVGDIVAQQGDTLQSIAAACNTDAVTLATNNEAVVNPFATATGLQAGMVDPANVDWHPDDTLATLAQYNKVTVEQLGAANQTASAVFANFAVVAIPGTLNSPQNPACTYTAASADTLGGIAGKFGQQDASGIAALNPDLPGLFAGSQPITSGGQTVTTASNDTFVTIQAKFQSAGVTLTLAQLAAVMAPLTGLIQSGGLWICPPTLGNAGGLNSAGSLAGLATAYNTDAITLGTANAAVLGFVASGVSMNSAQWPGGGNPLNGYVTNAFETLNSLTNRVNQTGFTIGGSAVTVTQLIAAVSGIAGLIAPAAQVLPVPPPNPPNNAFAITPGFTAPVFQISVNVISGRLQTWVDDDFKGTQSVYQSNYSVSPNPDPGSGGSAPTYSLTNFATVLQAAIPGLKVATGDAVAEDDSASATTIWGVNFGSSAGPQITYQFGAGSSAQYFALPPLCTSQLGGPVGIYPYASGAGIDKKDPAVSQTFQSVDLDDWMRVFLDTIDLFLTPSYASAAYAVDPADTLSIISAKGALAGVISNRMEYVLQSGSGGSMPDAVEAMRQAMLTQLGSAYTIDTLVQVPVTVSNASSTMEARLAGKLQLQSNGVQSDPTSIPDAYSFSTAKVELPTSSSGAAENATFLFSVKSPAAHKSATLPLEYVITDLELPSASASIGDYQGSNWLKFVLQLENTQTQIGQVEIPIPLRSYPSPVLLVSQTAEQTVAEPQTATDLLGWNLDYIYQHTDAEQDTPTVVVKFNPPSGSNAMSGASTPNAVTQQIFQALAQFMAAYPILKDDLALLPTAPPSTNLKAFFAVQSLAQFAASVIQAFVPPAQMFLSGLQTIIYAYQIQKVNTSDGTYLQSMVVTSVDPATGQPAQNPTQLWPAIYEYYWDAGGSGTALTQVQPVLPTATQVTYTYPANSIPAGTNFAQQFFFGGVPADTTLKLPATASLPSPQVFQLNNQNVLNLQSARAGVSITRNLSLVGTPQNPNPTNPDFVYQTPLTSFTGSAVPYVFAGDMIQIKNPQIPTVAGALGLFLKDFFTTQNQWQPGQTVNIRLSAAYSYALATSTVDSQTQLGGLVPIVLVPDYAFNPVANGNQPADWDATNPASFVSQLGLVFDDPEKGWFVTNNPVSTNAFYIFDVTIYADTGDMQPIVRAASLSFSLAPK